MENYGYILNDTYGCYEK